MSYEKKYLKYKTKYLSLKSQFISKNLMTGGSNDNSFENLDLFSETITSPSIDMNFKLVSLLNNFNLYGGEPVSESVSEPVSEPVSESVSESVSEPGTRSESGTKSEELAAVTPVDAASKELAAASDSVSSDTASVTPINSESSSEAENSAKESLVTPKKSEESEPEKEDQSGGKRKLKVKSHKKYFFDDSDINLDSTTTNSDLSSLDTDSTDDSDL